MCILLNDLLISVHSTTQMKSLNILILLLLIASVARICTTRNGIIHNNEQVALILNDTIVENTRQPKLQVRRVKFCDKCQLNTHYDITSVKCPLTIISSM